MIRLYDSALGEVVEVVERDPGRLGVYVCGPTVYGPPHLGHGRFTLVWDVARRWYTFAGYDVRFISNVTDVDDKIIARARAEGVTEAEVAAHWEAAWFAAMDALGVARPDETPHATQYVGDMIDLIDDLVLRGSAYATSDGVYFDVAQVDDYGLLAGQPLEGLRAGARVEVNDEKRSPLDFALWKAAKPGEPAWDAPFGAGRPGWHTECVVMSLKLLGESFDLHTGGLDLKFPHHENERAQAVAAHRLFARHWAHHGFVMVGDDKMSKSLNNYTTIAELLAATDPRAYRLLVLRSLYRSPIDVSPESLADATRALARLDALARRFALAPRAGSTFERAPERPFTGEAGALVEAVSADMAEDLDSPSATARLFDAVTRAHRLADEGDARAGAELAAAVGLLFGAMGLGLSSDTGEVDAESAALVAARDEARARRDFSRADELRDELESRGWVVEDSPEGTTVRR